MVDLEAFLHEEYESDESLVLFRCTECGYTSLSLGGTHGHIEKHRGHTRFGIKVPFTKISIGNFGELMKRTEVLRIDETSKISLAEVDGL